MSTNKNLFPKNVPNFTEDWSFLLFCFGLVSIMVAFPVVHLIIIRLRQSNRCKFLRDKVVLITGASSGLGEAMAYEFYEAGCKVILTARREKELERVKNDLQALRTTKPTHPPVVYPMDLSDLKSIPKHGINILAIYNKIDILINNAGIGHRGEVINTLIDVDLKVMMINYFGTVALTKAFLPSMIKQKSGRIVCVSSVQGRIAIPYRSAYAASKHALQAFCDSLRAEVAKENIKVTVSSPGYIRTNLSLNAVTGSGEQYGVINDDGYSPEMVAKKILNGVYDGKPEILTCPISNKIAILIRAISPSFFFLIMKIRAKYTKPEYKKSKST